MEARAYQKEARSSQVYQGAKQLEVRTSQVGESASQVEERLGQGAVSYTHLTLPTNREV